MLIEKNKSIVFVIDVQEKLVSAMPRPRRFIDNIMKLLEAAKILKVPAFFTEQYPDGLGKTIFKLREKFMFSTSVDEKTDFAYNWTASEFVRKLRASHPDRARGMKLKEHFIICGIEAHVCVLQTAFNLAKKNNKNKIYVVQDAVASRNEKDYLTALSRLDKHPNIQIVTCEMVLFEWLRTSDHPDFKTISQLIK